MSVTVSGQSANQPGAKESHRPAQASRGSHDSGLAGGPRVRVDPATAFQLALFAEDLRVRDAAAESLWSRAFVDQCEMEVGGCEFASLPFAERVAALIVACSICIHPTRATRHRVVPLHEFLVPARRADGLVHAFRFGARPRGNRLVLPHGGERHWPHSAMFRLPKTLDDTTAQRRTWRDFHSTTLHRDCGWQAGPNKLSLFTPYDIGFRISPHDGRMQLVDHEGQALPHFGNIARVDDREIRFDPSFLLRLESGRIAGGFLSYESYVPCNVSIRMPVSTLSIEFGSSSTEPVVMRALVGNLKPRYDVDAVVGRELRSLPAFEGATIDELDRIARFVGVWQGGYLRASFEHHPLRRSNFASAATNANHAASATAREVA